MTHDGPTRDDLLRLETIDLSDARSDAWAKLAEASGNIFSTWEWTSLWWRHFGAGRSPLVVACRDAAGDLVAVLPLVIAEHGPLRVVRLMGHGPADELGPVCAPENRRRVAQAVPRALLLAGGSVFIGEQLPGALEWGRLLGGTVARWEASPVITPAGRGWDEYLSSKSRNFREQVRMRERRLLRQHAVTYRLADDPGRLHLDMDALFSLHKARWGTRSSALRWEPFHREFAARALEQGWLRLWFLEMDGRPAAAWYGFRFGGVETFYQSGRDPFWERASVGFVLLAHTIREAFGDGVREYRLLRGDEAYKYRFADRDPGVITVVLGRGIPGYVAAAAATAGRTIARMRRGVPSRPADQASRRLEARESEDVAVLLANGDVCTG